jgi:hypothetical protein
VHVLADGYAREDNRGDRVDSTVTLITDGAVIVDPLNGYLLAAKSTV